MQKRQVFINSIMSVVHVLVMGGALFVLYRFLLNTIGDKKLGVWVVVASITSLANIGNLGLSSSGVKFVSQYLARGEEETVLRIIETLAISICLLIGLCLLLAYPFSRWILSIVVPQGNLLEALSIFPYTMLSLWITVISMVFQSGLDGYQRIDIRSTCLIAGTFLHLALCFLLVPANGLMGLAYARIAQAVFVLLVTWIMLKRFIPMLPFIPYRWNYRLFREMVGYSANIQLTTICSMLYEPVTKSLMTAFGGLSMTAFYEMASRMLMQLRAIVTNAIQVFVPAIANLQESGPETIKDIYKNMYNILFYITVPLFLALIAFTPVISRIWIGYYESTFVFFSIILAISFFINTIAGPAYFTNLGTGELRWNVIGHMSIALLNPTLGFWAGKLYGGKSIAVSWAVSFAIGNLVTLIAYHYKHNIPFKNLLPTESTTVGLASLTGFSTSLLFYQLQKNKIDIFSLSISIMIIYTAITIFPVWRHPIRKRMQAWFRHEFLGLNHE